MIVHARAVLPLIVLTVSLGADMNEGEVARFLGPRPGQAYIYALVEPGQPQAGRQSEMVVTAASTGEESAVRVKEVPRIQGLSLPKGTSVKPLDYVLRAAGGELTKTSPDGETLVVMREPLTIGATGWNRVMRMTSPTGESVDYTGPCRVEARGKRVILGKERTTVTLGCRIKSPDGELVLSEEYALDVGMTRRQTDYTIDGKSTGRDDLILTKIVPEASIH